MMNTTTTTATTTTITLLAPSLLCPSRSFAFMPLSLNMQPPKSKCTQLTVISFANSMFSTWGQARHTPRTSRAAVPHLLRVVRQGVAEAEHAPLAGMRVQVNCAVQPSKCYNNISQDGSL